MTNRFLAGLVLVALPALTVRGQGHTRAITTTDVIGEWSGHFPAARNVHVMLGSDGTYRMWNEQRKEAFDGSSVSRTELESGQWRVRQGSTWNGSAPLLCFKSAKPVVTRNNCWEGERMNGEPCITINCDLSLSPLTLEDIMAKRGFGELRREPAKR